MIRLIAFRDNVFNHFLDLQIGVLSQGKNFKFQNGLDLELKRAIRFWINWTEMHVGFKFWSKTKCLGQDEVLFQRGYTKKPVLTTLF